jgi:hypothetical protein
MLNKAAYNPRILNDNQKRKLKAGLKRHGLVAPVTWNARTGNIVGGHQRIGIMDSIMGTEDYKLHVSKINVTEGREKELNLLLNNSMAQGDWDIELLDTMLKDSAVDIEGTGFELGDVYQMLGTSPFAERQEDAAKMADKLADISALYDKIKKKNRAKDGSEYYLVMVFRSEDQLGVFLDAYGLPNRRYHNGELLMQVMGKPSERMAMPNDRSDQQSATVRLFDKGEK